MRYSHHFVMSRHCKVAEVKRAALISFNLSPFSSLEYIYLIYADIDYIDFGSTWSPNGLDWHAFASFMLIPALNGFSPQDYDDCFIYSIPKPSRFIMPHAISTLPFIILMMDLIFPCIFMPMPAGYRGFIRQHFIPQCRASSIGWRSYLA